MKARDVMTPNVVTVGGDTPVQEIARLMLERRVSAVPVVNGSGRVLGLVSESDLIHRPELGTDQPRSRWLNVFVAPEDRARSFVKSHGLKAEDVMTRPAIAVSPDATLAEVVHRFDAHRIKRVLVLEGGALVGIVTRSDLLRALHTQQALPDAGPARPDQDIRQAMLQVLSKEGWAASAIVNVQVADGVVHLWGAIESEEQRTALRVAAEGIAGVRSVVDHLGLIHAG